VPGNARPQTLIEAVRYFSDVDVCTEFVAKLRWPNDPICPRCGGTEYSYITTRRLWKCKACKRQYSVKVGTIFEDSPLGLDKWLPAIWMVANSKNGISSHELGRALGITQKSAWFVLHRVRLAMQTQSFLRLATALGMVERGGRVRAEVVPDARRTSIQPRIHDTIEPGARVYTDGLRSYQALVGAVNGRRLTYAEAMGQSS
jgi:transposase-like protein